jgi:gliding motility-associated lipoprotein GldD
VLKDKNIIGRLRRIIASKTSTATGKTPAVAGVAFILLVCVACGGTYTPKPRAYMRIDLPTSKDYRVFDSLPYPYTFEYPAYSRITPDAQKYWLNVEFPAQNSTVYLSYNSNISLDSNIAAALFFVEKHFAKSTGIEQISYNDFDNRVFGTVFYIKGRDVASTMQFYLTDSTRRFIRGSFYINARPNNDSLSPVIDLIQDDIRHLIQTFRWKSIIKLSGE